MSALTKNAILTADDLPREPVEIREWGGTVHVRSMSAAERDEWEASWLADDGKPKTARERLRNLRARLAVLVLVDEGGNRLFADEDADALGKKSAPALDKVFAVARRLNGLDAKDVDDLVKN